MPYTPFECLDLIVQFPTLKLAIVNAVLTYNMRMSEIFEHPNIAYNMYANTACHDDSGQCVRYQADHSSGLPKTILYKKINTTWSVL